MPAKCDLCGIETNVEHAFYRIQDSYSNRIKRRCPDCWLKGQTASYKHILVRYLTLAVVGVGLLGLDANNSFGWFTLNLLLLYLFMILAAFPHEMGHAFVATAVGLRVFEVVIGFGRTTYEQRLYGFNFRLKSIPLGGFVFAAHKDKNWYRAKDFLFTLAGPFANLFVAGILFALAPEQASDFSWADGLKPANALLLANLICFGYNLWPRKFHSVYGEIPNDGLLLWKSLFLKKAVIEESPLFYYVCEGVDCLKSKQLDAAREWFEKGLLLYPRNPRLLTGLGSYFLRSKQFLEAREVFLELLNYPDLTLYSRSLFANNLAYVNVLIGGDELIKEADKYSREAFDNLAYLPFVKGTRGAVLVELGKFDEGIALLQEALEKNSDGYLKALDACHIAIAEKRRGNMGESLKYADAARSLDRDCVLLDRLN
jgi:tetratricopeptide (TPR) repeat protein